LNRRRAVFVMAPGFILIRTGADFALQLVRVNGWSSFDGGVGLQGYMRLPGTVLQETLGRSILFPLIATARSYCIRTFT
jgi:hypothetical protein